MVTWPWEMLCNPDMHRIRVDFPLPDRPITTNDSPAATWNDTSRTPTVCPVAVSTSERLAPCCAAAMPFR